MSVDNDGDLDLLAGTFGDAWTNPMIPLNNVLHINDGFGNFEEASASSIATAPESTTFSVAFGDYDVSRA